MLAKKILSDREIIDRQGEFFDLSHYSTIIDHDCDIFTEEGTLLFTIRKKIIPSPITDIIKNNFFDVAKKAKTNCRGIASGKVDLSQITKGKGTVVDVVNSDGFQSQVKFANGEVSKYRVCNIVKSMIAGYYNKPKRGQPLEPGKFRLTAFCEKYPHRWAQVQHYVKYIDKLYSLLLPHNHSARKSQINTLPYGVIDDTIFTTLTINYNFRTACHVDKGNLDSALSILTTHGTWDGCYLGYPQYGICINVQEGDLLIMNPHQYHCNTEFLSPVHERLSIVTYTRKLS